MKKFSFRVTTWVGALALLLTACQKAEDIAPPRQLIARDKMVSLLIELHTLEARADAAGLPLDSARALFLEAQKNLYWRYEINDSLFMQSYRYYAVHDKDLDGIYAQVVDSLALREVQLQAANAAAAGAPTPAPIPPRN
ncbi:DUF4296 domain-containing protein [Hymenobacter sp. DG01]|uniref:DUF4296 domain-containing protein n=1 Tax=Hymenobacter sp. DG01 TaxID=2584940 RepID=UPI001120F5DC|nr:DUF4296 domain-containing protein [Hymenobacter sp. DG01]